MDGLRPAGRGIVKRLLVANRGEIAVRIVRAAHDLGIVAVVATTRDERTTGAARLADEQAVLPGSGPAAYLDVEAIVAAAVDCGCDALHPGYGFLSESPALAEACAHAGIVFVGPTPDQLRALGDKTGARELAVACGVPVLAGTGVVDLAAAHAFLDEQQAPVLVKAVAGGGGRGIRPVSTSAELDAIWDGARSEAERAFGDGRLFLETALPHARHIEIQVVGDGTGEVADLGERDCSLQRRRQKIIEIAPSPSLDDATRHRLRADARAIAERVSLAGVATVEFLVAAEPENPTYAFLEVNPRLQVEHTITEEVTGVDLVQAQLHLADGAGLDVALSGRLERATVYALQARVNTETVLPDGTPSPQTGTIGALDLPAGPGVRVDTAATAGDTVTGDFDTLLAKIVVRSPSDDVGALLARARRALAETRVTGVATNLGLLTRLIARDELGTLSADTTFVDDVLTQLIEPSDTRTDETVVAAPTGGTVLRVAVAPGDSVSSGQEVAVVEAMKMEYILTAPSAAVVTRVAAAPGDVVVAGAAIVELAPGAGDDTFAEPVEGESAERSDITELLQRKDALRDEHRVDATQKRHAQNARTARENVAALVDDGTFREYGGLVVAAQRARRSMAELQEKTPGDGVVTGFGTVNGDRFDDRIARSLVIAFDATVLAGTMGEMAREKLKRVLDIAREDVRPVLLLAEGGGGRAGDTDGRVGITGWTLDVSCYHQLGRLSGLVPLVGVVHGLCFAANAGVLACCDVIIATRDAHLGVGGPSMIEGGRLGSYRPDEIGPMSVQAPNGVVDVVVDDEAEAAEVAKRYLSYFQGPVASWTCPDQDRLRAAVPANRVRAYDVRAVIETLADEDSTLELRAAFGPGMITVLARVEGRPLGIVANNPHHAGGAIDSDGADKAARFLRLCDAFDLPVLTLCDTPGMMVGPQAEKTATVRKMGRLFVTGANLSTPLYTIVLRKAYGIGAELMAGGWFRAPRFTVAWPTGEFGGMNIEGNVQLAHRAELDAITDPAQRRARFDELVADLHDVGKALSVATHFEVDDVIDPAESRRWIADAMATHTPTRPRTAKKLPFVDPW